jgi:SAM-dependent methyltransferase
MQRLVALPAVGRPTKTGQDAASAAQNAAFFDHNTAYAEWVATLDTYRNIREAINREITGSDRLLDVGNGGVFDYDVSLAREVVGVDLFLDSTPPGYPDNVTLRRGDALALDEPDGAYDCVVEISVFHHLVGASAAATLENIRRAVRQAHRVLSGGGRLVVMESCVSEPAFAIERRLFSALELIAGTPLLRHPAVLQFPAATIASVISQQFGDVRSSPIPVGRWIIQFGHRWPVVLTPARPYLFVATRR